MRQVEIRCSVALFSLAEHRLWVEQALIHLWRFQNLTFFYYFPDFLDFYCAPSSPELIVWLVFLRFTLLFRLSCFRFFFFEKFVPRSMLPSLIYLF